MIDESKSVHRREMKEVLRRYITESFLPQAGIETFNDSDSFMEKGIIDSTGVLELLQFIEGEFEIKVDDKEVIPDNLDSLQKLTQFIQRKLAHAGQ
jgi:acyl carrier protein